MSIWFKLGIVGALLASLTGWHYYDRSNAVDTALASQRAIYENRVHIETQRAQETSISLLNSALLSMKRKDDEIKNITNQLSSLNRRLQLRTSREDTSPTPGNSGTCTGAELFREDGEFLAGEAARAQRILEERDFYYGMYQNARKGLEAQSKSTGSR